MLVADLADVGAFRRSEVGAKAGSTVRGLELEFVSSRRDAGSGSPAVVTCRVPGGGGSAIPWALVLAAARLKLMAKAWLPEVRVAAAVYW